VSAPTRHGEPERDPVLETAVAIGALADGMLL